MVDFNGVLAICRYFLGEKFHGGRMCSQGGQHFGKLFHRLIRIGDVQVIDREMVASMPSMTSSILSQSDNVFPVERSQT